MARRKVRTTRQAHVRTSTGKTHWLGRSHITKVSVNLKGLSLLSFHNRNAVKRAKKVGCYYCMRTSRSSMVKDYIDMGMTALCPHCQIDALLADKVYGFTITKGLLLAMHMRWFTTKETSSKIDMR